jgi:hypothetical protein
MIHSVNLWGSSPDDNNDDCHTGEEFDSLEKALDCYNNPWKYFKESYYSSCTRYIELDSKSGYMIRENPGYKPSKDSCDDWKREQAMQAGMAFGCDGYNEIMGYD